MGGGQLEVRGTNGAMSPQPMLRFTYFFFSKLSVGCRQAIWMVGLGVGRLQQFLLGGCMVEMGEIQQSATQKGDNSATGAPIGTLLVGNVLYRDQRRL